MRLIYLGVRLRATAFADHKSQQIKPDFPMAIAGRARKIDLRLERQRTPARRDISGVWRFRNNDWLSFRQAAFNLGLSRATARSDGRDANACLVHMAVPYAAPHAC